MSLVAYGSSDESEGEDQSETVIKVKASGSKSDFGGGKLSIGKPTTTLNDDESDTFQLKSSLFTKLPKPKKRNYDDAIENEPILGPQPKRSVKISIPSLSEFADLDEENVERKPRFMSGTGLFSVLPPPKNAAIKVVNRSFVPHSVSNKATAKRPSDVEVVTSSDSFHSRKDDGDDSGDEGAIDFFSLENVSRDTKLPVLAAPDTSGMKAEDESVLIDSTTKDPSEVVGDQDAPLQFDSTWASSSTPHCDQSAVVTSNDPSLEQLEYDARILAAEDEEVEGNGGTIAADPESMFNDEAFLRIVGKDRKKKDEIQIIDVAQDDQIPKYEEWLTKSLTEDVSQKPTGKKGPAPTSQQRRKHQITYLAHQAREREVELKNMWAENRMTKRQTQSKYGF